MKTFFITLYGTGPLQSQLCVAGVMWGRSILQYQAVVIMADYYILLPELIYVSEAREHNLEYYFTQKPGAVFGSSECVLNKNK